MGSDYYYLVHRRVYRRLSCTSTKINKKEWLVRITPHQSLLVEERTDIRAALHGFVHHIAPRIGKNGVTINGKGTN